MMLAKVLHGIIFFIAVASLLAESVEEEKLENLDAEFDVTANNGDEIEEDEKPSFDNAVDIQEG